MRGPPADINRMSQEQLFPRSQGDCRLLDNAAAPGNLTITPGDTVTLFKASASDRNSEVITATVQLARDISGVAVVPPGGTPIARPSVLFIYGAGGVNKVVAADVGVGWNITIGCSALEIRGVNDPIPALIGGVPAVPTNVNMGAFVAYGALTRPSQLKRTLYMDNAPIIGIADFFVPVDSTNLIIYRDPVTAGFTVTLFDDGGNPVGQQTVAGAPFNAQMIQMDFSDDVRIVEMTTIGITTARLVFGLATG